MAIVDANCGIVQRQMEFGKMATLTGIMDDLLNDLRPLAFNAPVTHVYNPLQYAFEPFRIYLDRYGHRPKSVILIGMNPGPWGMAQTGIPFGDVNAVRHWLKIEAPVGRPGRMHPKRPVQGFACKRGEVSGRRLWGWVKERFGDPEQFFNRFFVVNYCPLSFMEKGGRNRTPNTLPLNQRKPLFAACDRALYRTVEFFKPRYVIGIGAFAEDRARRTLSGLELTIGRITHPSPANPKANKGWAKHIEGELKSLGIPF